MGSRKEEMKLKIGHSLKFETSTQGVNKTMLVPTLSHSTRGAQEEAALPFVATSRCSAAFPLAESGSCTLSSVHSHVETWQEIFLPTTQYPSWATEG